MNYRRAFIHGGSFFFTVVTESRLPLFADAQNVVILRDAFHWVQSKYPFTLAAAVILPDHLHCIWTLPPADSDFSTRWRLVKTWFTKHCDPAFRIERSPSGSLRGEQSVWQHRYWEHALRDETDYRRHVEYIHYNPVKHGYVESPRDWEHTSFHRYVNEGLYPTEWGEGEMDFEGIGHE
jgi:putative transposase